MSDVTDIDPSLRALDALADDFADPGDETAGCPSMWPLLAVPSDALSPLDRDARDRHLARCARCRVALTEAWLDGDGLALAPVRASLPAATALPALPDRRRRGVKVLAGLSVAAAAAASIFAIVFPMMRSSGVHTTAAIPYVGPMLDARPLELVVVVEDGARDRDTLPGVNAALARLRDHVPPDTRVTVTAAHDRDLDVLARDRAPSDALTIAPLDRPAVAPVYESVLAEADALFRDQAHRRAIVIVGAACGEWSGTQSVDSVRGQGVAVVAAEFGDMRCNPIAYSGFVAHNSFQVVGTIGDAVDAAVREASGLPEVEHRTPLDLLVLVDGSQRFLGRAPSAYDEVRVMLDEIDPHIPEHSLIRFAVADGDAVTVLGHGDYYVVSLARSILGESRSYDGKSDPRWSLALDRARHLLDMRHDRQRALLVIGDGGGDRADKPAVEHALEALRADGVKVAFVTYRREVRDAIDLLGGLPGAHSTAQAAALSGLVFDAVEDFSRPAPTLPPADLLHFVHDTLSAP